MEVKTFDDLKTEVLSFLKSFKGESTPEQKFVDYKLQTGEIISVSGETLAENATVQIIDTDGNKLPMPTGSYVLEDGTMISVTDGVISKVEKGEAPKEEVAPEEEMADASTETQREAKRVIESVVKESVYSKEEIDEKLNVLNSQNEEKFSKVVAENETLKADFAKQVELNNQVIGLLEKFAQLPSEKSAVVKKDGFKKKEPSNDLEKLMAEAAEFSKSVWKD